jgi:hypothetical protein
MFAKPGEIMNKALKFVLHLAVTLLFIHPGISRADDEVKKLQDAKALVDARSDLAKALILEKSSLAVVELAAFTAADALAKARAAALDFQKIEKDKATAQDVAQVAALTAATELAKAKAAVENAGNTAAKAQYESQTSLAAAKVNADFAELAAMKASLGAPPSVGTEGLAFADGNANTLQQIKSGSLDISWRLARELCGKINSPAFFAPEDLETKIQASQLFLRDFDTLAAKVVDPANVELVKGDVTASSAGAAILGAATIVQYGAAALQGVVKLFRSDYTVGMSETKRDAWFEYFVARQCPKVVALARPDLVIRGGGQKEELTQLGQIAEFIDNAANKKTLISLRIAELNLEIAKKDAEKKPHSELDEQLDSQKNNLKTINTLDVWLPRAQALLTLVGTKPELFQEAFVWRKFGMKPYSDMTRIHFSLRTQDAQIVKTNWLLGKRVYGKSAGELVFRISSADGKLLDSGFFLADSSTGKLNFDMSKANVGTVQ